MEPHQRLGTAQAPSLQTTGPCGAALGPVQLPSICDLAGRWHPCVCLEGVPLPTDGFLSTSLPWEGEPISLPDPLVQCTTCPTLHGSPCVNEGIHFATCICHSLKGYVCEHEGPHFSVWNRGIHVLWAAVP